MPLIRVPQPWYEQPNVPIRLRDGFFDGLVFGDPSVGRDGFVWTNVNKPTQTLSPFGPATQFVRASAQARTAKIRSVGLTSLTLFAVFRPRTITGIDSSLISLGASTNDRALLYVNQGKLAMFSGTGGTTSQALSASALPSTSQYVAAVGRILSATQKTIYYRTQAGTTASNTFAGGSIVPANATVAAVGGYYTSGALTAGLYADADIVAAGWIPRAISDAETVELCSTMLAWLRWVEDGGLIVPSLTAASGLPTLSLSTYKPGTLTSTGWTPRITAS